MNATTKAFGLSGRSKRLAHIVNELLKRDPAIRYEEDIWHLIEGSYLSHMSQRYVRWHFTKFKDGGAENAIDGRLLDSAKSFFGSMLIAPSFANLRRVTLWRRHYNLRTLILWMNRSGYHSFNSLDSGAIDEFFEYFMQKVGGTQRMRCSVSEMFRLLQDLSEQGPMLDDCLHPAVKLDTRLRDRLVEAEPDRRHLFPSDDEILRIIGIALAFTGAWVEDLIGFRTSYIELVRMAARREIPKKQVDKRWQALLRKYPKIEEFHIQAGLGPIVSRSQIAELIRRVYDASYVLIAAFTGMRLNEIHALEEDCIVYRKHSDGNQYCYLRAPTAFGTAQTGLWVAPPLVATAIDLLTKLRAPLSISAKSKRLFMVYAVVGIWPSDESRTVPMNISDAAFSNRINQLSQFGELGTPSNWHFTTHQFRRAFARFVAMRDKRGLLALSEQYGHVHWAITDTYYVGTDVDLERLIGEVT
ncbi:MAG: hypothetical protein SF172_15225 [Burkholderiales bacterium]|nr:hypothetical protein [Burkholderiales bacterium]